METKDQEKPTEPVVMIVERRKNREKELTSAEVMKILRKRSAKKVHGEPDQSHETS